MSIYDFVKTHKDENLTFASFDGGSFYYHSEEIGLKVEFTPYRLNDCEFSSEETIMTLFEQLGYYDELDFTHKGKFIGSLTNGNFKKFLEIGED
ncbi:hypothetical protein [Moraxella sp. ZY200743]|uniref:hypothetical protein n=1 Tax=Moraxella sp. ZY200743 TaxID=2911970 RepID=UPI003D7DBA82